MEYKTQTVTMKLKKYIPDVLFYLVILRIMLVFTILFFLGHGTTFIVKRFENMNQLLFPVLSLIVLVLIAVIGYLLTSKISTKLKKIYYQEDEPSDEEKVI